MGRLHLSVTLRRIGPPPLDMAHWENDWALNWALRAIEQGVMGEGWPGGVVPMIGSNPGGAPSPG